MCNVAPDWLSKEWIIQDNQVFQFVGQGIPTDQNLHYRYMTREGRLQHLPCEVDGIMTVYKLIPPEDIHRIRHAAYAATVERRVGIQEGRRDAMISISKELDERLAGQYKPIFWDSGSLGDKLEWLVERVKRAQEPVNEVPPKPDTTETLLQKAEKIINGPRRSNYGPPEENFVRIATMWTAYMLKRLAPNEAECPGRFTAHDVAVMLILLKCARAATSPNFDTFLDIAGYAGCAERLGLTL